MAIDVIEKKDINRPADAVADYMFEPVNDPVWIGGIEKSQLLTERPVSKGTQVKRLAKFMGKEIDYILEVTDFKPRRLMAMKGIVSPFPMVVTYSVSENGPGRSVAQVRIQGSSKGFYKIADLLMKPMVRKNLRGDMKRLKEITEKQ